MRLCRRLTDRTVAHAQGRGAPSQSPGAPAPRGRLSRGAGEVINCVNDSSMELLRAHFQAAEAAAPGTAVVTLEQVARQYANADDVETNIATLCRMHAALLSSTDDQGAVQTFYPLTEDEQYQLACAVRYVQHATDFFHCRRAAFTGGTGMHSMSIFAHSVRKALAR